MIRWMLLVLLWAVALSAEEVRYPGIEVDYQGTKWTYYAACPKGPAKPMSVVLLLHGAGGSGGSYLALTGWGELARQNGFLVVAPNAPPRNHPQEKADFQTNPRFWKSEHVPFFDVLLEDVARRYPIRKDQVFCVGHSNGATMAFQLAGTGHYAAVAGMGAHPKARGPIVTPTLVVLGDQDSVIPLAGGTSQSPWGPLQTPPVRESLDAWARAMGYDSRPSWQPAGERCQRLSYGQKFETLLIEGQGHVWPGWTGRFPEGFGPNRLDCPAAPRIWEFLQKQIIPDTGCLQLTPGSQVPYNFADYYESIGGNADKQANQCMDPQNMVGSVSPETGPFFLCARQWRGAPSAATETGVA